MVNIFIEFPMRFFANGYVFPLQIGGEPIRNKLCYYYNPMPHSRMLAYDDIAENNS